MCRLLPTTLIVTLLFATAAVAQTESGSGGENPGDAPATPGQDLLAIQQARLAREEARQMELETARKRVEWEMWWDRVRPTAPKMAARERAVELERARYAATDAEIASGKSLNVLLASLQMTGERGPSVPLSPTAVSAMNLSGGTSAGCPTLLKHGVRLSWPEALDEEAFDAVRAQITRDLRQAVNGLKDGDPVPSRLLKDLRAALRSLSDGLDQQAPRLSPTTYVQGRRFLNELKATIHGLSAADAVSYFTRTRSARGETVGALVEHMSREGLVFAPATPGEEASYRAVYLALRRYEQRVLSTVERSSNAE